MTRATEVQSNGMELSAPISAEIDATQAGAVSAMAREQAELQGALVLAKKFPRNETQAHIKIMKSCDRASFADEAIYSFPRGGQAVEGPSVNMARELARCWGNVQCDLRIVSDDDERVHIRGVAWDVETNTRFAAEDKFKKLIQRKGQGWIKPDERDLRELTNRRGAIVLRNAILQLIPKDIVEDALARCRQTLENAAAGKLKQDPKATRRQLAESFDKLGVSVEMIEKYLGHAYDQLSPQEYAKLRAVWQSISDGNSKREEHFEVAAPTNATVDLSSVKASESGAAPRASTADSLKPTGTASVPPPAPAAPPTGAAPINLSPKREPGAEG